MRAISATSLLRDGRWIRVSKSMVSMPQPSVVNQVTPSARWRSYSGTRAPIVK